MPPYNTGGHDRNRAKVAGRGARVQSSEGAE